MQSINKFFQIHILQEISSVVFFSNLRPINTKDQLGLKAGHNGIKSIRNVIYGRHSVCFTQSLTFSLLGIQTQMVWPSIKRTAKLYIFFKLFFHFQCIMRPVYSDQQLAELQLINFKHHLENSINALGADRCSFVYSNILCMVYQGFWLEPHEDFKVDSLNGKLESKTYWRLYVQTCGL